MENHWGKDPNRQTGTPEYGPAPDLDEIINGAVRLGTGIGSTVLSGISYALDRVEEGLNSVRGSAKEQPFAHWKRKLDKRLQDKNQGEALALAITGWTLAACFGIAAVVMWALAAAGPQGLGVTQEEFLVFSILMACFTLLTVGFGIMGGVGVRKYRYISRLRRYLRGARDWVCEVSVLAQASLLSREQVCKDLQQAVANGDLPNALLEDGKLYLDLERCAPEESPAPQEPAETEPALDEAECFRREGAAFLEDLRHCSGKLSADAEEELVQMQKICAAIFSFVHNHPEQLPRVRRLREYYLPTTRKLLDTAQGLGEADGTHAQEIRRDITGILHTLNQAYSKLYDTLLQDVSLDVSTEIDTLETMLRQDGLTHDFESDFKNG